MQETAWIEAALNLRRDSTLSAPESVVLFGASFNPVTLGHLDLIHALLAEPKFVQQPIYLIPAACSPLKSAHAYAAPKHRLAMLNLALTQSLSEEQRTRLHIETLEIERETVSRMIVTIALLTLKHQGLQRYTLACGYDHLACFTEWYEWRAYKDLSALIFYPRQGYAVMAEACLLTLVQLLEAGIQVSIVSQDKQQQVLATQHCQDRLPANRLQNLTWIVHPELAIRATQASEVRTHYRNSRAPSDVTAAVHEYILAHHCYQ